MTAPVPGEHPEGGDGAPPELERRAVVPVSSVLLLVGAVVAAFVVAAIFEAAHRALGWVVAAGVIALLVDPIIEWLNRYLNRWIAVLLTFVGLGLLLGGLFAGAFRNARDEVDRLIVVLPDAAKEIESSERFGEVARDFRLSERVEVFVAALDERVGSEGEVAQAAAGSVPTYVVGGVLAIFLLVYGPRIVRGGLAQVDGEVRRARLTRILGETSRRGRGYLLATLAQCALVGLVTYLLCQLADVTLAFVLAVFVGAFAAIPYLGIVIGSLPVLLLAAGTASFSRAGWLLVAFAGLQVLEALVVRRRVDARTLRVGPAPIVVALLLGYRLYGIGGAVYGVALAVLLVALADAAATDGAPAPPAERVR